MRALDFVLIGWVEANLSSWQMLNSSNIHQARLAGMKYTKFEWRQPDPHTVLTVDDRLQEVPWLQDLLGADVPRGQVLGQCLGPADPGVQGDFPHV